MRGWSLRGYSQSLLVAKISQSFCLLEHLLLTSTFTMASVLGCSLNGSKKVKILRLESSKCSDRAYFAHGLRIMEGEANRTLEYALS